MTKDKNITWQQGKVNYEMRCKALRQQGQILWFTGLSGAGKSSIAIELEARLLANSKAVYRLDGDNIRHGLNSDLAFSKEDRDENIRRITEVANLFKDAAIITLVSFISPYQAMRDYAREVIGDEYFNEIYVKASLDTCIKRDPKGLYKQALKGEIKNFTGVSAPYEVPNNPELVIDTEKSSIKDVVDEIMDEFIKSN